MRARIVARAGPALLPLLLLVSGCDGGGGGSTATRETQPIAKANGNPAPLEPEARRALEASLGDLDGFMLSGLREGTAGSVCGRLRTPGGLDLPFLVMPDGTAMVADAPGIRYEDPGDRFAGYYLALCATPEVEREAAAAVQAAMAAEAAAGAEEANAIAPVPDLPEPDPFDAGPAPVSPDPPPAAPPSRPPPPPPRTAGETPGSFRDAVIRPPAGKD